MGISKRLKTIAGLVSCERAADIGTDHGKLPVYLLREGISKKVIASDKSEASCQKAREICVLYGLEGKMEVRRSDGLQEFAPYEADSIIISGMGGILMKKILEEGLAVTVSARELILSPHRDLALVKEFLADIGFSLTDEIKFTDKNKEYSVIRAVNEGFFLK